MLHIVHRGQSGGGGIVTTLYLTARVLLHSFSILSVVVLPWLGYGLWVRRYRWVGR